MIPINTFLEHTQLSPVLTDHQVNQLIEDAQKYRFVGVCIPPFWVKKVKRELQDTAVRTITVVGFPLGHQMTETKVFETNKAIENGADEIDVVWSLSAFKSGMNWPKIELAKLSSVCHDAGKILKVIVETAYLDRDELVQACKICTDAGVDIVKTSTGFAPSGARLEDVKVMREVLPDQVGIKASGGIKTLDQAKAFVQAGADRIGTSTGVQIMEEWLSLKGGSVS
ncbi:deoxyribose-phosphate aldolase [Echinicola soli]|uniref:Deoxyribose-phosphate aldolase n=1 Tax=Echinicola soli TaxID=2591634 RepID=A0A514CGF3_9BACT|nr:deoxyribose-phosphate aldolase [Echinicola soli]QDH78903.1 deoxyribose-phosphate aldolase [Echinicola soli]